MLTLGTHLATESRLQQTVSPQLVLQSQIMELSSEELLERIQAELEANPALEIVDEVFYSVPAPTPVRSEATTIDALEYACAPVNLRDDLRFQLGQTNGPIRRLCEYLVECLDERGFLDANLAEIAALFETSLSRVQEALRLLQSLEPAGVGARNLRECLLLQLDRIAEENIPHGTRAFIENYLDMTRTTSPRQAAARVGLSDPQLAEVLDFIGSNLYMWPADRFRPDRPEEVADDQYIFPDAWIVEEQGRLRVKVAQSWSHGLRVSDAYARLERDVCDQRFDDISDKVRQARVFIHHLVRREATLKRVTEAVVASQREFFAEGPQALKPLTRKEIAAQLEVHESTISRITRGKYVQLPDCRLVPFDFFFDNSLSAKAAMRVVLNSEDPRRPLSDATIADLLEQEGYLLARRTVAKYRDQLGIPPAHERKRMQLPERRRAA